MLNQPAFAVEDEGLRDGVVFGAQISCEHVISRYADGVVDAEVADEATNRFRRRAPAIIYVQADDFEAARLILFLQAGELRHFLAARRAPRRPEVHDHDFALI